MGTSPKAYPAPIVSEICQYCHLYWQQGRASNVAERPVDAYGAARERMERDYHASGSHIGEAAEIMPVRFCRKLLHRM
jgi:hypothetical protein